MSRKLTTTITWQLRAHELLLSLICSNHKFSYLILYAATEEIIKFLTLILILTTLYVCVKVNTSKSHRRFNTQLSTQKFQIFFKILYAATEEIIKFLMLILILTTLCMCMKVNTSRFHRRFNTQLSKDSQNIARVFPFILKVKHLTLDVIRALAELEILWKIKSARVSINRV